MAISVNTNVKSYNGTKVNLVEVQVECKDCREDLRDGDDVHCDQCYSLLEKEKDEAVDRADRAESKRDEYAGSIDDLQQSVHDLEEERDRLRDELKDANIEIDRLKNFVPEEAR